jgi:2-C-methyl-D-erythritol 4-phosphate cytidylyltransferase
MKIGLVITAAGKGSRFKINDNKIFTLLDNDPLLIHTYKKFLNIRQIKQIVIPVEKHMLKMVRALFSKFSTPPLIVEGGITRKESVECAFKVLKNVDMVMVHDGARPLVSVQLINTLIKAAKKVPAVIPGIPTVDTIKVVTDNKVKETLPRDKLILVQTPQIFAYDLLAKAYQKCFRQEMTDEALMIEKLGYPITVIKGEPNNIKITYPIDKKIAEILMSSASR